MDKTTKTFLNGKNFLFAAALGAALASCSDDLAEAGVAQATDEKPQAILFSNLANTMTREANHEQSAQLLGGKILFYGAKTAAGEGGATNAIFDNYRLQYTAGSKGSTATNVADWEYVGLTSLKGAEQDVKYWDYTSAKYDFVAASGLASGESITNADSIKVNVASASAMDSIYVSDRITRTPREYNKTVTFKFRRLGARMRIGFYETVPGYAVKRLRFYYAGAESGSYTLGVGGAFPQSGKYNVTYDSNNAATVKFNGGSNKMGWSGEFGKLAYTSALSKAGDANKPYIDDFGVPTAKATNSYLSTSSAQPTFAKGTYTIDGQQTLSDYKPILPNENNSLKMQLRVDYTLIALDGSGDSINVRDAYVSVPVEYVKWKPNYAYTYIFKISDKSNGYTGKTDGSTVNPDTDGRDPNPDTGGDSDPEPNPDKPGEVIPPYVPDPSYPDGYIPDPDNPGDSIPNPDVPVIPNPDYPTGPKGDQHDPSNPVPTPTDPTDPEKPDPYDPAGLYPITFDGVVVDTEEYTQETITTVSTPGITAKATDSDVTANGEYKVGETIYLTVQDGMTPTRWQSLYSQDEISEKKAEQAYGSNESAWTTLNTNASKGVLTPTQAGYYVVRVQVGEAYGYKVIKVVL